MGVGKEAAKPEGRALSTGGDQKMTMDCIVGGGGRTIAAESVAYDSEF